MKGCCGSGGGHGRNDSWQDPGRGGGGVTGKVGFKEPGAGRGVAEVGHGQAFPVFQGRRVCDQTRQVVAGGSPDVIGRQGARDAGAQEVVHQKLVRAVVTVVETLER